VTDGSASGARLCPRCGYDRTGLVAGAVCPECNAPPPGRTPYPSMPPDRLDSISFRLGLLVTAVPLTLVAVVLAMTHVVTTTQADLSCAMAVLFFGPPGLLGCGLLVAAMALPDDRGQPRRDWVAVGLLMAAVMIVAAEWFALPRGTSKLISDLITGVLLLLCTVAAGRLAEHATRPRRVIGQLPPPKKRPVWSWLILAVVLLSGAQVAVGATPSVLLLVGPPTLLACGVCMALSCWRSVVSIRVVLDELGR